MPKTFYQITKNEKHTIRNKTNTNMKKHGTMYCFGCKDFTHYFKPQEVKMKKKKCSEKNQTVLFVDQISRRF